MRLDYYFVIADSWIMKLYKSCKKNHLADYALPEHFLVQYFVIVGRTSSLWKAVIKYCHIDSQRFTFGDWSNLKKLLKMGRLNKNLHYLL